LAEKAKFKEIPSVERMRNNLFINENHNLKRRIGNLKICFQIKILS